MALLLRKRGIRRVRPLEGGFDAWREAGYPLERLRTQPPTEVSTELFGSGGL